MSTKGAKVGKPLPLALRGRLKRAVGERGTMKQIVIATALARGTVLAAMHGLSVLPRVRVSLEIWLDHNRPVKRHEPKAKSAAQAAA